MYRWVYGWLLPIVMAGCVSVPKPLTGGHFINVTPAGAQTDHFVGQRVRWGGGIVTVEPGKSETCFEVVSRPLGSSMRPQDTDRTDGRFSACASGFYDPVVYAQGREVTFVGTLQNAIVRKLGEYEYRLPRVKAETVYLWPKREIYPGWSPYYYDPYWYGPWGPWPRWYWYPYW